MNNLPPPDPQHHNNSSTATLRELQGIRRELEELRERFDDFAAVYLAAKFPYGQPVDRWHR